MTRFDDDVHGLPPEARRRRAQLDRAAGQIAAPLGVLAAIVLMIVASVRITRTPAYSAERTLTALPHFGGPR